LLSESRVVSRQSGVYGTGLEDAIGASNTWENESKLAELYIDNLDNFYGADIWDESNTDVFEAILGTVDVAVKSDSTNLLGLMDNDDFVSWFGGLALAVRDVSGETPELYVNDFTDPENLLTESLNTVLSRELTARYFNPSWIGGMMGSGYAGAQEMDRFVEFLWMWEVTTPDVVSDASWDQVYETYVLDSKNLGLDEFFSENAYSYQSIAAQLIETSRKGYWDASDEVVQNLVKEYVESVVEDGVTCCHHTCGNPLLDDYIQGVMSVPGVVDEETAAQYKQLMEEATTATETESSSSHSSSSSDKKLEVTNQDTSSRSNQTTSSQVGAGADLSKQAPETSKSTPDNYVEGYEMTKETVSQPESNSNKFSGSDIVAFVLVVVAAGAVFLGFMRKKKM